jgi:eukaryotic-like serine/threonine-protein kinase
VDYASLGSLVVQRFEIRRRLGTGGFGEVYEAFDRHRGEIVALKLLKRTDAAALYRFKKEFRTLANLVHRNLVTLYELSSEGDQWLLTMELIRGVNFVDYVRAKSSRDAAPDSVGSTRPSVTEAATSLTPESGTTAIEPSVPLPFETLDVDRVRAGLRELVEGVRALHQQGILHLDIKPSNVLVDERGRVVLVDFGLAERLGPGSEDWQGKGIQVLGTPEYMSPEQAAAHLPSPASDWYCVGALLYRALTGVPTFSGPISQVLRDKLERDPTPPAALVPQIPADLDRLCSALLRRDPRERPDAAEILIRLGASAEEALSPPTQTAKPEGSVFVGRSEQLAALGAAFEEMRSGKASAVYVHGPSGMGKTALARHFLDKVRADPNAVVLEGRCYEQEAMPFKAFDSIVDALSNHLRQLSDSRVTALLPREVGALARVFPVLQRVYVIASARDRSHKVADVHEVRRRAFVALRELLARLAQHHPLVLFIDDLQWGDVDSATLLDELLRPPDPPPLMLLASYRSDEVETSACLRALVASERSRGGVALPRRIAVGELQPHEAAELALALLPTAASQARADGIAREARGNPFFIDHLSRHALERDLGDEALDTVLWNRTKQLPAPSQRLMEVIAVAGSPVEFAVATQVAEVESGKHDLLASLRAAKFIRTRARDESIAVEPYHDRIRETIVAHLPPEALRQYHYRLALALEASSRPDPEALALHFKDGGDVSKAAMYAIAAADKSANALAFDGAARLYSMALALQPNTPERGELYVKLADALAMSGRVIESAGAYIEALDDADPTERVELRRRAGEQYLLGGHLEEGLALLKSILADMGMKLPSSPRRALLAMIVRQLYLRFRGTEFRERHESEIPKAELQRLDMCHAVCRGLGFTDSIRAIELQTRHLLLALKAGEPYRLARALTFSATADGVRARTRPHAEQLLKTARELAERVRNPHAIGLVHSTTGLVYLAGGKFAQAVPEFETAETILREKCTTVPYEVILCYIYRVESLYQAGALKEYFRSIPEYLAICKGRGDILGEGNLHLRNAHCKCFAEDDLAGARQELQRAEASWRGQKLQLAQANYLFREIELALYEGQPPLAWELVTTRWHVLAPLRLFGFQGITTQSLERRAYCALAMAANSAHHAQDRYLRAAERDARELIRWKAPWGAAVADLVRAGIAAHRGQAELAISRLDAAERKFRDVGMALHLAITRWRQGLLIGGDAGNTLVQESKDWMSGQGVRNPDRLNAVIAPGRWAAQ